MAADGTQGQAPLQKIDGERPEGDKLRVISDKTGGAVPVQGGGTSHLLDSYCDI